MSVRVSGLDYLGRGVARENGQVLFIEGVLPNEMVDFQVIGGKKRFLEAVVTQVIEASPSRVTPACAYYAECGGCALQHIEAQAEVSAKETLWREQLARIAAVAEVPLLPPITHDVWRYRRRARLAVQYDEHGKAVVGFRARRSHRVVGVEDCLVLDADLAAVLPSLTILLSELPPVQSVSLHRGEAVCALALVAKKHLPLAVLQRWASAQARQWQVWVNGVCVFGEPKALFYDLPAFEVKVMFAPEDFTQVNAAVNQALVAQAVDWVVPEGRRIMDFFAGLGNFSLPFARLGGEVQAIEGVQEMVKRGNEIAQYNGLAEKVSHQRADLFTVTRADVKRWQQADVWFLDPPRAGAQAVVEAAVKTKVARVVYVSCDAATLARDVKILLAGGYQIRAARVANMFARTAHIESIMLFERGK